MPDGCADCDHGWRHVQEGYVMHWVPDPPEPALADLAAQENGPELVAELWRQIDALRAVRRAAVYPCKVCQPRAFFRWAGGHWAPDHDPAGCDECTAVLGARTARSMSARTRDQRRQTEHEPAGQTF